MWLLVNLKLHMWFAFYISVGPCCSRECLCLRLGRGQQILNRDVSLV